MAGLKTLPIDNLRLLLFKKSSGATTLPRTPRKKGHKSHKSHKWEKMKSHKFV